MKTSTLLFFLVGAFLALNTTLNAQTCEPGLEQIPPIANSDWSSSGTPTWNTNGNQELANMLTFDKTGNWVGVAFVKGSSQTGSVKACGRNSNHQLLAESAALNLTSTGIQAVDTVQIFFNNSVFVTVGESGSAGIKFAGFGNRNVRNFDDAEGTRFQYGNLFNEPFPSDLGNLITQDGLYAIWAIVEDCVEPTVPGCTEQSACNYNPLATENDMTCDWSCLEGCERCDANGDGVVNQTDLSIFFGVYGTTALVGADLLDSNGDGTYTAADLLNIFGCFGQALSAE